MIFKSDHQKCKLFYNVSCNELYCVWYFKTSVNENSLLFVIYKSKKKKNRLLIKLMEGKQPLEPKCIQWVCDKYVTVLQFDN